MTYDSENYIQHISYTLSTVARKKGMQGAYEYVKKLFAEPIGLPTLFDYDATGTEFSAGGGQMMSCRDIARVGQVFLNKGMWLDANSKPYQMSDPTYLAQMVEPAFPGVVDGYGLLTWLNTDMRKPADDKGTPRSHCCAPRWANGKGTQPSGVRHAPTHPRTHAAPTHPRTHAPRRTHAAPTQSIGHFKKKLKDNKKDHIQCLVLLLHTYARTHAPMYTRTHARTRAHAHIRNRTKHPPTSQCNALSRLHSGYLKALLTLHNSQ